MDVHTAEHPMLPVPFHGNTLYLVDDDGTPMVPMKPVVDGIGLSWQGQHKKLTNKEGRWNSTINIMLTVAEDGREREMICLPLRKLHGWLMSIEPSKVKPEIRSPLIAHQNKCDDVLWEYWSGNRAFFEEENPSGFRPAAFQGHEPGSLVPIAREFSGALRLAMGHGLSPLCARAKANTIIKEAYHIDTGLLVGIDYSDICPPERIEAEIALLNDDGNSEAIEAFWATYYQLEGERKHTVNHSKDHNKIAINIKHFKEVCTERGLRIPEAIIDKRLLKSSKSPKFIESNKSVSTAITGDVTTVKCWVFHLT